MKKVILTLLVFLSCIMIANARWNPYVVDTLPKRIINGLEVIPIRRTYQSGKIFWKLRTSDFNKCFQKFESKYPGKINYNLVSKEEREAIFDWQDHIWETIVPTAIKALRGIDIMLFIDKDGRVFTADFSMTDEVFQKLNTLPRNTLKNIYRDLIKETCKTIKDVEFRTTTWDDEFDSNLIWKVCGSKGTGKEYVTIDLSWTIYDMFGTRNVKKLSDSEIEKMLEESAKRNKNN